MTSESASITARAAEYIFTLFSENLAPTYVYHTYEHICDVVKAARKISVAEGLSRIDKEIVELACWFHDAGYIHGRKGHEERSAEIATEFLLQNGYTEEWIPEVCNGILATRMSAEPQSVIEAIVCDADVSHIGRKSFQERSNTLRAEQELTEKKIYSDLEWIEHTMKFLTNHKFHTQYAIRRYTQRKIENIVALQSRLHALLQKHNRVQKKESIKEKELKQKEKRRDIPERGVETMFRVTMRNHTSLSSIADSKANTMLSINALIISIVVTLVMSQLDTFPVLVIPAALLLAVCLVTISLATIATRPQVTSGIVTKEMVAQRKANLLFFGNFYNMPLEEFEWGMNEMLQDREYLYGSLIKDFYSLGVVLARKYKYLRLCYNFFMYGMIISVLLFLGFFVYLWK